MRTSLRTLLLLATAVVGGLCTASSAFAANVAPNPSFENACGSAPPVPCGWNLWDVRTGLATHSTTSAHTGLASLRVYDVSPTEPGTVIVRSDCIEASPSDYDASFWRRADGAPDEIRLTSFRSTLRPAKEMSWRARL
jgi:hypothetical protein